MLNHLVGCPDNVYLSILIFVVISVCSLFKAFIFLMLIRLGVFQGGNFFSCVGNNPNVLKGPHLFYL